MLKRIFISTDFELHGMFNNDIPTLLKVNASQIALLNNNDVVYYNGVTFDTTSAGANIILVKDSSTTPLIGINAGTDFLLHHTRTTEHQNSVVHEFKGGKKQGMHSQRDEDFYKYVFKEIIFNDTNTDKLNSILQVLGFDDATQKHNKELESKLNFLHNCLTPSGAKIALQTQDYNLIKDLVESLKLEGSDKTILKYMAEQEDKDCFDEEKYLKHLRTLRDKLLVS